MKKLLQQKKLFKVFFWLWGLAIFILSSLPNIPSQQINIWDEPFRLDYLEHFLVFAILGTTFIIWKSDEKGIFSFQNHFWIVMILFVFAGADEIHQIWIPGRTFNPLDLIYNELGLIISFVIVPRLLRRLLKK